MTMIMKIDNDNVVGVNSFNVLQYISDKSCRHYNTRNYSLCFLIHFVVMWCYGLVCVVLFVGVYCVCV